MRCPAERRGQASAEWTLVVLAVAAVLAGAAAVVDGAVGLPLLAALLASAVLLLPGPPEQRAGEGIGRGVDAGEVGLRQQREAGREADERAEGDDVQRRQRPGVLVAEDRELLLHALLHLAEGGQLHDGQRQHQRPRNRDQVMHSGQLKRGKSMHQIAQNRDSQFVRPIGGRCSSKSG